MHVPRYGRALFLPPARLHLRLRRCRFRAGGQKVVSGGQSEGWMDGEGPKWRGDLEGDTNEGRQRGAEAGMHALPLLGRSSFFLPQCMTSMASAFPLSPILIYGRRCRAEGGVRRLGHLALLRDVLSWLRWTRPGRARTSTSDVGSSQLPTEVSRDQPILFACLRTTYLFYDCVKLFCRSLTSVYACGP
jgi:hypothetical protein